MECRPCLVLHKTKWEPLKKQAGQLKSEEEEEAIKFHNKKEYYKTLDEQSKEWQKNWPDTVEGCLAKVKAKKDRQLQRNKAFVKAYEEKERQKASGHAKVIAEAKQKIFHTSNYGQQLISAVLESKVIEERKLQIEFKKFMKQKSLEYDEAMTAKIASMENNIYDLAKKDEEAVRKRKEAEKEQGKINKMIHEYNEYQKAKEKEEEKLGELEDSRLQKLNLDYEKHEMDHCKEKAIKDRKQYEADKKAFKERKLERNQEDDALVEVWAKYRDRFWCREKQTREEIIKGKGETENYKKAYEMAEKALENDKKNYERFVDKGIEKLEKRQKKAEENIDKEKQKRYEDRHKQVHEDYKAALEVNDILKHWNKCACDKQSLFVKPGRKVNKKILDEDEKDTYKPESFLAPYTTLSEALNQRKAAKSPWSALAGEHQYFAARAAAAIRECTHKHMAKKVVDDYKKSYNLDSTALPLPDY